jgi:hypothetical protein
MNNLPPTRYRCRFHARASGAVANGATTSAARLTASTPSDSGRAGCRIQSRAINPLSTVHTLNAAQTVGNPISARRRADTATTSTSGTSPRCDHPWRYVPLRPDEQLPCHEDYTTHTVIIERVQVSLLSFVPGHVPASREKPCHFTLSRCDPGCASGLNVQGKPSRTRRPDERQTINEARNLQRPRTAALSVSA